MVIIGVDPHKRTHTASALDPGTNTVLSSVEVDASLGGYRRLLGWAAQFEDRRWAIENARGLGRHLAQWLIARGEIVEDVPSTATARVRELSRGGRRKNDVIDAAAAASVAAGQGDANPVPPEDTTTVMALLDERRDNLITHRTRLANQLHALLRDLIPGGAPTGLTAKAASALLGKLRPAGQVETVRKAMAKDLVREIADTDRRLREITAQIAAIVNASGSHLTDIDGVGPVIAARLLGRTRGAARFASPAAFANYAGVAPVEVASAGHGRHRLPRGGDRQLNLALHIAALTQVRMKASIGRAYYDKKVAEGKDPQRGHALPETTPRRPSLESHDQRRTLSEGEPGRTHGGDSRIQRGWLNPDHRHFGQVTSRTHHDRLYDPPHSRLTEHRGTLAPSIPTRCLGRRGSMSMQLLRQRHH